MSLSSRWTSLGRVGPSNFSASSRPSTCCSVLVPPCVARAGQFVEHDRAGIAVNEHPRCQFDIGIGQRTALARRARGGLDRRRRHDELLPGRDAVRDVRLLAVERQLSRARPAREQRVRRALAVTLEPAVEADAVVFFGDRRAVEFGFGLAHAGTCRTMKRPSPQATIAPITDART